MSILDDILGALNADKSTQSDAAQLTSNNAFRQQGIEDIIGDIQTQVATNNATIAQQKGNAELQLQNTRLKNANIFGTNTELQTQVISSLADTATKAYNDRADALESIKQKQSVTLFDNPLEYLMNRFTINSDIAKHNAADESLTNAENRIKELNSETQTQNLTSTQLSQSLSQAAVEAGTRNAAVSALLEAQKSKLAGIGYNTAGIDIISKLSKEHLNGMFRFADAANASNASSNSDTSLALHIQEAAQRTEQVKQMMEDRADTKLDKADVKEFYDNQLSTINAGRKARGAEELTGSAGKQVINMMKNQPNSPITQEYLTDYQIGEKSQAAGTTKFANNIGDAVNVADKVDMKLSPAQETVRSFLGSVKSEFINEQKTPGTPVSKLDPKDTVSKTIALATIGRNAINNMAQNIKPGDESNILNIGSLNYIASASPAVKDLPVYQKIFATDIANGVQYQDPKVIFQKVVDGLSNKTISYNEALELTTVFQAGVTLNAANRNFKAFGIDAPMSYISEVPLKLGGQLLGNSKIDYTKPDLLGRALLSGAVNKAAILHQGTLENPLQGSGILGQ